MFAKCLQSKCNDNIRSGVSVHCVSFSAMSWRRNAALSPFVQNAEYKVQYLHSYLLLGYTEGKTPLNCSQITHNLPFAKLFFSLRCVKAGFVCVSAVTVSTEGCNLLGLETCKSFILSYNDIFSAPFFVTLLPVCTSVSKCLDKFVCRHES